MNNLITIISSNGRVVTICDVPVTFKPELEKQGGEIIREFYGLCDVQFKDHIVKVCLLTSTIYINKIDAVGSDDIALLPLCEVSNIYT